MAVVFQVLTILGRLLWTVASPLGLIAAETVNPNYMIIYGLALFVCVFISPFIILTRHCLKDTAVTLSQRHCCNSVSKGNFLS